MTKVTNKEAKQRVNKPILHLNLTSRWFDLIASSEKKEEYRELKPYWARVFSDYISIKGNKYKPSDVNICFSNGYAKARRQMTVQCKGLKIKEGKREWGAEPGRLYFTLFLGEVLSKNF